MPSPFYFGGHVAPDQFVGRRAELQRIFAALEVKHTRQLQSISVVGPRRIGKSSLLFYLASRYAEHLVEFTRYRIAYVNLHDADCKTQSGLLFKILQSLRLASAPGKKIVLTEFQNKIRAFSAANGLPVVCLDEFEALLEKPEEFPNDLYDSWRYLMDENAIGFVTASKTPLSKLAKSNKFTSPFFNIFILLSLGILTPDEAQALADRGLIGDRPFTRIERDLVLTLGERHPYKLQVAGDLVYQAKADGREADRETVQREFTHQIRSVGLEAPPFTENWQNKLVAVGLWLITCPKYLGRALLEGILRLGKDTVSETTPLLIGYALLIILLLLLANVIGLDQIKSAMDWLRGTR